MKRPWRKWGLAAMVAATHLAALWWIAGSTPPPRPRPEPVTEIGLVGPGSSLAAASLPAAQPQPPSQPGAPPESPAPALSPPATPLPAASALDPSSEDLPAPDLTQQPIELNPAAVADLTARAAKANGAAGDVLEAKCAVVDRLRIALQADVQVQTALAMIPSKARSVANGISVWNQGWSLPEEEGGAAATQVLQAAVRQALDAVAAACRLQTLHGPRLIVLDGQGGPTVLAIGSGAWRWADVER